MGIDDCDRINGMCINTDGNYTCECNRGYSGDGKTCSGRLNVKWCESLILFLLSLRTSVLSLEMVRHITTLLYFSKQLTLICVQRC